MERDARPGLRRLVHALRYGSDVSAVMLRILDEAEQAAARIDWSGGGVVAASSADDGAAVGGMASSMGDAQSTFDHANALSLADAATGAHAPDATVAPPPRLPSLDPCNNLRNGIARIIAQIAGRVRDQLENRCRLYELEHHMPHELPTDPRCGGIRRNYTWRGHQQAIEVARGRLEREGRRYGRNSNDRNCPDRQEVLNAIDAWLAFDVTNLRPNEVYGEPRREPSPLPQGLAPAYSALDNAIRELQMLPIFIS